MSPVIALRKAGRPRKDEAKTPEIDLSKWFFINPNVQGVRIMPNELGIQLGKKKISDTKATVCRLKIGSEIAKKINLNEGDNLCFYSNPNDLLSIVAVKRSGGNKVGQIDGRLFYVNFGFENRYDFKTERTKIVPHTINKQGYLLFRIEGNAKHSNIIEGEDDIIEDTPNE